MTILFFFFFLCSQTQCLWFVCIIMGIILMEIISYWFKGIVIGSETAGIW